MPGNVTNDSISGTLPWSLSTQFIETREWPALVSEYKDGSSQRQEQARGSRKSYQFGKRLTAAQMTTLRNFFLANIGTAFKVYTSMTDYDAHNASFRLMRFDGRWAEDAGLGRSTSCITLIEVA